MRTTLLTFFTAYEDDSLLLRYSESTDPSIDGRKLRFRTTRLYVLVYLVVYLLVY